MHSIIGPGFFSNQPVHVALAVGAVVALVSAVVGVFTVLRGQSFAGHSLADVATAGGAGAFLAGFGALFGFVAGAVAGAGAIEAIDVRRARGRDLAAGIVLSAALGLAALFLYLDATTAGTTGASQEILFGSIFTIDTATVAVGAAFGAGCLALTAALARPLQLTADSDDIAAARGVPVRAVGLLHMLTLALAVGLSSLAIGAILSTALLIGPAAIALRLTRRVGPAVAAACAVGIGSTWLGVLLSYDSYYWTAGHRGWPVSFFVVAVIFVGYLATSLRPARPPRGRDRGATAG